MNHLMTTVFVAQPLAKPVGLLNIYLASSCISHCSVTSSCFGQMVLNSGHNHILLVRLEGGPGANGKAPLILGYYQVKR